MPYARPPSPISPHGFTEYSPADGARYVYNVKDQRGISGLKKDIEFLKERATWLTIKGDKCCVWVHPLEGKFKDKWGGELCAGYRHKSTWQIGAAMMVVYANERDESLLPFIDGIYTWTKHALYTRNGVFQVNAQRQLVDSAGRAVSGEGGPVVIPSSVGVGGVNVATDGSVSAAGQSIGQLKLVEFDEPTQLIPVGDNSFSAPQGLAPLAATEATVHQGFQEASNVRVVEELVDLIAVTRLYEANLKSISAQDERMRNILNVAMG